MDVASWLKGLGLPEYADAFAANHVDGQTLRQLTADDLRELGVTSIGHRRRLLDAIAALGTEIAQAPEPVASERRPVAIVFADLCGYTQLSRELDDERLRAVIERYLAVAGAAVARHGGTVDKHIGDSCMALFGAPVAHGDDMARALRMALDLQAAMPALCAELGRALACHVGIASGDVIVGTSGGRGYTAVGEAVNLAARLTSLAPPGDVYVAGAMRHALDGQFRFETRGRQAVKGFAEPVEVWSVAGHADGAVQEVPLVGRSGEIAQLAALLDNCRGGTGSILYVRGEPGIGKSRLVAEARRMAGECAIACHVSHILDFGSGQDRDPLRRLADSLLGLAPGSAIETRAAAVDGFLAGAPVAVTLQPYLYELTDTPAPAALRGRIDATDEATRQELRRSALALLVERALASGPVMLLVEDLHWADAAQVEALARLAAFAADRPLVLALTTRPEREALRERLQAQRCPAPFVTIDLAPLRASDAAALIAHFSPAARAIEAVVERTGGNPLFIEQLMRNGGGGGDETLPPSLRGIVVARVDRLARGDRSAIQAAAALGQRFDQQALRAVLNQAGYDPAGLVLAGLLRRDGTELAFAHALIQEAVYRSLLGDARRALHRAAAAWFADRDPLLTASHLDRAEAAEAADAYRAAAEDRLRRYRPAEALPLAERGLQLARTAGDRAALGLMHADILLDAGRARDALAAYEAALAAGDDARQHCLALLGAAAARRIIDALPAALDNLAQAEALATAGNWLDLLARCRFTRGNLFFPLGRVDDCLAEHRAALDIAQRIDSAEAKARALGGIGDGEYACGRMAAAGRYFQECVAVSRAAGLGRIEVSNLPMYAHTTYFDLRLNEALDIARQGISLSVAVGQKRAELISHHAAISALLELGRSEACRPAIARCREIVGAIEAWRFEPENLAFLAEVELRAGNLPAARLLLDEALAMARKTAMTYWGPAILAFKARLTADAAEADALAAECEALLAGKVLAHNHHLARRQLIERALEQRRPHEMEAQADKLAAFHAGAPFPLADFIAARARVLAGALRGEASQALAAEAARLVAWGREQGAVCLAEGLSEAPRG